MRKQTVVQPIDLSRPLPGAKKMTNEAGTPAAPAISAETNSPISKSTTTIDTLDLDAQILRDGQPFTSPTRWSGGLASFDDGVTADWKLFPGAASNGENVHLWVTNLGPVADQWAGVHAVFSIDNNMWRVRPGQLFVEPYAHEPIWPSGAWSCVIHFPQLSNLPAFAGTHTLLLRTLIVPAVTR